MKNHRIKPRTSSGQIDQHTTSLVRTRIIHDYYLELAFLRLGQQVQPTDKTDQPFLAEIGWGDKREPHPISHEIEKPTTPTAVSCYRPRQMRFFHARSLRPDLALPRPWAQSRYVLPLPFVVGPGASPLGATDADGEGQAAGEPHQECLENPPKAANGLFGNISPWPGIEPRWQVSTFLPFIEKTLYLLVVQCRAVQVEHREWPSTDLHA